MEGRRVTEVIPALIDLEFEGDCFQSANSYSLHIGGIASPRLKVMTTLSLTGFSRVGCLQSPLWL